MILSATARQTRGALGNEGRILDFGTSAPVAAVDRIAVPLRVRRGLELQLLATSEHVI